MVSLSNRRRACPKLPCSPVPRWALAVRCWMFAPPLLSCSPALLSAMAAVHPTTKITPTDLHETQCHCEALKARTNLETLHLAPRPHLFDFSLLILPFASLSAEALAKEDGERGYRRRIDFSYPSPCPLHVEAKRRPLRVSNLESTNRGLSADRYLQKFFLTPDCYHCIRSNWKLRAYPNNRLVMRPSEKSKARAAEAKLPQA